MWIFIVKKSRKLHFMVSFYNSSTKLDVMRLDIINNLMKVFVFLASYVRARNKWLHTYAKNKTTDNIKRVFISETVIKSELLISCFILYGLFKNKASYREYLCFSFPITLCKNNITAAANAINCIKLSTFTLVDQYSQIKGEYSQVFRQLLLHLRRAHLHSSLYLTFGFQQ